MIPAQLEILHEVARYSDDYGAEVSDSVGAALEEIERLRAILDAPQTALFADGREPTRNERHLLNLLSWRQKEAADAKAERDKLQAFKSWTHNYLDRQGVPQAPPGPHGAEGCRIGDRLDWLTGQLGDALAEVEWLRGFLRGIRDMAAEDLRKNLVARCASIHQIEADATKALGEESP